MMHGAVIAALVMKPAVMPNALIMAPAAAEKPPQPTAPLCVVWWHFRDGNVNGYRLGCSAARHRYTDCSISWPQSAVHSKVVLSQGHGHVNSGQLQHVLVLSSAGEQQTTGKPLPCCMLGHSTGSQLTRRAPCHSRRRALHATSQSHQP